MRALLVGNGADFDPGFVGQRFREHGYAFTECHREHPDDWPALEGVDLVVTLGSEWNVYRASTAGAVAAEAALVRRAGELGVPQFAICFGAQVLSHALGGAVSRTVSPEIGWFEVQPTAAAEESTIDLGVVGGPWMQWHVDVFTVPDGFAELAVTAVGPQLMVGGRALATQFHPEVTETMVRRWLASGGAEQYAEYGGDPEGLLGETRDRVGTSRPRSDALVDWFLEHVAGP